MKKILKRAISYPLTFAAGFLCLLIMIAYIIKPDTEFSSVENRYLTVRPKLTISGLADGSFMDSYEDYTNEQILGREFLVKAKAFFATIIGKNENDGIVRGKDGYLFEKNISTDSQLNKNIAAIKNFVGGTDREVYIAIAPTSSWVYEDKIPEGMPTLDEETAARKLSTALESEANAHIVDLYGALCAHSAEEVYYRTDHHWTTLGASYAYEKLSEEMGFAPHDVNDYDKHTAYDFYGTFYAKYKGPFVCADSIDYYDIPVDCLHGEKEDHNNLLDTEKLETYDKYAMFMYGNDGKATVNCSNSGEGRSLIIVKDSYANCLVPMLAMSYDEITVVDLRYFGSSFKQILSDKCNSDILLLYNWSHVNDDNHFYKLVQ